MIILKLLNNIGDLVFWLAFLVAFTAYSAVFYNLPRYIWWPMVLGMGLSGIAGILLWFFK